MSGPLQAPYAAAARRCLSNRGSTHAEAEAGAICPALCLRGLSPKIARTMLGSGEHGPTR